MAYPEHDRRSFFKYTSAETAIKILESSSVLYSSPVLFNDPFDIQSGLHFDFDIQSFPETFFNSIAELVLKPDRPQVSELGDIGKTICLMWEKKVTHGFPEGELRALFREPMSVLQERMIELQSEFQAMWWQQFLPRLRVFSVSEDKDSLLMWSHYANYHTGLVFEFRVMPEQDNPLCIAKPIRYQKAPPALLTWKEFLESALHNRPLDQKDLLEYAYFKSDIWSYEKEWRVYDLLPAPTSDLSSLYPLWDGEIEAVYFGCKINPQIRARIIELVARYRNVAIYQAARATEEFRLNFISM